MTARLKLLENPIHSSSSSIIKLLSKTFLAYLSMYQPLPYVSQHHLIHLPCTDIWCNTENGPIHQPSDTDGLADEILRVVGLGKPRSNRCDVESWKYGQDILMEIGDVLCGNFKIERRIVILLFRKLNRYR